MSGYFDDDSELDFLPDYDTAPAIFVPVPADAMQAALRLSQRIQDVDKQWSVYLNAIALGGLRAWFNRRTLSFTVDESKAVILAPTIADGTGAVCHLLANQWRLSLIAVEPEQEDAILLPGSLIQQANLASHFYLPIAVYEEQETIGLSGYFSYDQLMAYPVETLMPHSGNTIRLPKAWLNHDMESLLLYFNCLEPTAIVLPQLAGDSWRDRVADQLHQLLVQPALNTAQWFQAQAAQLERSFDWILMPPISLAGAMRTRPTQVEGSMVQTADLLATLHVLLDQGLSLNPDAQVAYRELRLGTVALRLYAIVSLLDASEPPPSEWSLLLILKHQDAEVLPDAIQLEVRELATMNLIQHLQTDHPTGYLFMEVIGALAEQFLITIATNEGVSLTLPPLQWQPT
jgi:hypothetical protein